jgi:hypothetical protein
MGAEGRQTRLVKRIRIAFSRPLLPSPRGLHYLLLNIAILQSRPSAMPAATGCVFPSALHFARLLAPLRGRPCVAAHPQAQALRLILVLHPFHGVTRRMLRSAPIADCDD